MTVSESILLISLCLQFLAAALALRLIRITRHWGWALLSIALLLMAGRRVLTLSGALSGRVDLDLQAESVALVISALMFAATVTVAPFFRGISAMNDRLRVQHGELEHHRNQLLGLNDATLAMHNASTLQALLDVVAHHAQQIIGAHQVVTSVAINRNWAQAITGVSLSEKYAEYRSYDAPPDGSGIYAMVCETREPVRMTQAQLEVHPRWQAFGKEAANHPPMRGWLAAPILLDTDDDVGLIQLSDRYEGEFSESDEAILLQLAEMASAIARLKRSQLAVEEHTAAISRTNAALTKEVAEHQQARDALVAQASELKRSNEDLDEFAYVASHQLKEPLRGIHNYAAMLLDDYRDRLEDDGRHKLEMLGKLTQRLETLIDDLLYYSRIGRTGLSVAPTSIQDVVEKVLEILEPRLQEKHVACRIVDDLPTIVCDQARVGELFQNLIMNAVMYNDKQDPRVEIGVAHPEGADSRTDESKQAPVVFTVSDNGLGIRDQHQTKIFRMFKRLHGRDKFGGTGMGLAIAKSIVERHGGRIWVESTLGEGTTFFFTLEAAEGGRPPEDTRAGGG